MVEYPRDLIGYGSNPPKAEWPEGARLALQFVLLAGREPIPAGHAPRAKIA